MFTRENDLTEYAIFASDRDQSLLPMNVRTEKDDTFLKSLSLTDDSRINQLRSSIISNTSTSTFSSFPTLNRYQQLSTLFTYPPEHPYQLYIQEDYPEGVCHKCGAVLNPINMSTCDGLCEPCYPSNGLIPYELNI